MLKSFGPRGRPLRCSKPRIQGNSASVPARIIALRRLSTARSVLDSNPPVELEHAQYIPEDGNTKEGALVILHGLFGSKRNWTTLSKAFVRELKLPIYALDLRNQGASPHVKPMTYSAMASDVIHFIKQRTLSNVTLLGHSMGGKVAMTVALDPVFEESANRETLSRLVVVDVSPTRGTLGPEFRGYVEAMQKIEKMRIKTRKEAMRVLEDYEDDLNTRAFLLTNLETMTPEHPYSRFKVPLDTIAEAIPDLGDFPYEPGERKWEGRTLFIKGRRSPYINRRSLPAIDKFFPNCSLEALDAGHWVHGDQPEAFKNIVEDFITGYENREVEPVEPDSAMLGR